MVHDSFKVAAITESRQRHLQSVEAIEQVGAESPRSNGLVETGVRSGDEKDIDLGSDAANGAHGPVVKQAQKHGLERDGHVAHLLKEQRAAVSLLDESNCTATPRAGERAVSIAEELGLNQAFGKGGAIDGDEGSDPPAGSMGVAGKLFLDEMAEFGRAALDVLRQPLEDGSIVINRIGYTARMPCRFTLVGAMNPCVCGQLGRSDRACACTPAQVAQYRSRVS